MILFRPHLAGAEDGTYGPDPPQCRQLARRARRGHRSATTMPVLGLPSQPQVSWVTSPSSRYWLFGIGAASQERADGVLAQARREPGTGH